MLARIAWKNHANGARNPRAQFRKEVAYREHLRLAPRWPGSLGVFDCAGVADGAAAAIVVRAEDAHRYTEHAALHQGALVRRPATAAALIDPDYDYTTFPEVRAGPRRTPTARPASPTRGRSWRWPRCTTASHRPSSC